MAGMLASPSGNDRYRAVLATPFEDFEAEVSRYPLYERIAEMLWRKGFRTFVPHRDIKAEWSEQEVYHRVNDLIIPKADLVIADIGLRRDNIGSTAVGMMTATALIRGVPLVCFYEEGRRNPEASVPTRVEIHYQTNRELLDKLEAVVSTLS